MDEPSRRDTNIQMADIAPERLLQGDTPRLIDEWQIAPKLWDATRYEVDTCSIAMRKALWKTTTCEATHKKIAIRNEAYHATAPLFFLMSAIVTKITGRALFVYLDWGRSGNILQPKFLQGIKIDKISLYKDTENMLYLSRYFYDTGRTSVNGKL